MSSLNMKKKSLYQLSRDDSMSSSSDYDSDDDLFLDKKKTAGSSLGGAGSALGTISAGSPPPAAAPKSLFSSSNDDGDSSSEDDDAGWSSSDGSTSHSTVELDEFLPEDKPQVVAKGRLEDAPPEEDPDKTPKKKNNLPSFLKNKQAEIPGEISTPDKKPPKSAEKGDDKKKKDDDKKKKDKKKDKKKKGEDESFSTQSKKKDKNKDKKDKSKDKKDDKKKDDKKKDKKKDSKKSKKDDDKKKKDGDKKKKDDDDKKTKDSKKGHKDKAGGGDNKQEKPTEDKKKEEISAAKNPDTNVSPKAGAEGGVKLPAAFPVSYFTGSGDSVDDDASYEEIVFEEEVVEEENEEATNVSTPVDLDESVGSDEENETAQQDIEAPPTPERTVARKRSFFGSFRKKKDKDAGESDYEADGEDNQRKDKKKGGLFRSFRKKRSKEDASAPPGVPFGEVLGNVPEGDENTTPDLPGEEGTTPDPGEPGENTENCENRMEGSEPVEDEPAKEKPRRTSSFFAALRRKKNKDDSKEATIGDEEAGFEEKKPEGDEGSNNDITVDKDGGSGKGDELDLESEGKGDKKKGDVPDSPSRSIDPPGIKRQWSNLFGLIGNRNNLEQSTPNETDLEGDGHISPETDEGLEGQEGEGDEDTPGDASRRQLFPDVEEDEPDVEKGQLSKPKKPKESDPRTNATPFPFAKLVSTLLVAAIIIVLSSIGTAYLGTKLAIENNNYGVRQVDIDGNTDGSSGGNNGPAVPTIAPVDGMAPTKMPSLAPSECENSDNHLLEFTLTFDSSPADVGFSLTDLAINTGMWVMKPRTFLSFNQLQRKNIFRICISSVTDYRFDIEDTKEDGLVTSFFETYVYGSWELRFNKEIIASYDGDCEKDRSDIQARANNATLFACGAYSSCSFTLGSNYTGGECIGPEDEDDTPPNGDDGETDTGDGGDTTDADDGTGGEEEVDPDVLDRVEQDDGDTEGTDTGDEGAPDGEEGVDGDGGDGSGVDEGNGEETPPDA